MFVGRSSLEKELQEFFLDIGIPMLQGYGLTEPALWYPPTPRFSEAGHLGKMLPWLTEAGGGISPSRPRDGKRGRT